MAAKALVHVNPDEAIGAGVILVVIDVLKNPDVQVAWQAAQLLGEMRKQPELAVPALIGRRAAGEGAFTGQPAP